LLGRADLAPRGNTVLLFDEAEDLFAPPFSMSKGPRSIAVASRARWPNVWPSHWPTPLWRRCAMDRRW
jgi:hypothetical protein